MTQEIPKGSLAKITKDHDPGDGWAREGQLFEVLDFVPEEDSEDGQAFYVGNGNGGYANICALSQYVEQVLTPEQVSKRRIPTPEEFHGALVSAGLSADGDNFYIHTAESLGEDGVLFEGSTYDGLDFYFQVKVVDGGVSDF